MIRTLGITPDREVRIGIPLEELVIDEYMWVWVDFNAPLPQEAKLLDTYFHFHPLAVEDCMHILQRPKLDHYENLDFLVLHALNPDTLHAEEVNLFLSTRMLVSFHHTELLEIDEAWDQIVQHAHERKVWDRGPIACAYTVIDKMVDRYFPSLYMIEDELADLESLGNRSSVEDLMNKVFALRGRLLKLRRTVVPMRDLMYRVIHSESLHNSKEYRIYFQDIHDHLLKLTDMLESDREMTADLRDSYISLNSNRLNSIMKTLTVITTIFMPLTLIAGIYGMNFLNMPELEWEYSYFIILGIMVALGSGMVLWFRSRGWFK